MKISKQEILTLWKVLEILGNSVQKIKFSYFIAKNKGKLRSEAELLSKLATPSDEYVKYDQERVELAESLADKDENGKPLIENNSYVIIKQQQKFEKELEKLKNKNKDIIEEFEQKLKDYNEILQEEVDFNGYKIDLNDLPEEIEPRVLELFIKTGLIKE